jgi:prepilin peptidase CpaA
MFTGLFIAAVATFTLAAAATDLRSQRVPNWLTVPTAIAGLAFHAFAPSGWGAGVSLAGFALGFALLFLPWLLGGSGMGDVKLLAALGAWLGPLYLLVAFGLSMAAGSLLAIATMSWFAAQRGVVQAQRRFLHRTQRTADGARRRPARALPFAVPVALASWAVVAWLVETGRL